MPWDDRYDTGHPEIDRQHRLMFELIERIGKVEDGTFKSGKNDALDLMLIILQHAAYEEKLMARYAYPKARDHCDRHRMFTHKIIKFREDIIDGHLDDIEYQNFLNNWWQEHVADSMCTGSSDKQLAAFLAGRM